MPEALPQFVDEVLAACKVGGQEAGAALARAFEGEVQITLGPQGTLQSAGPQLDLQGKGLLVLLKTDRTTVVMTIPAAKGLVPAWCAEPDPTGESKLATLAQELGMNLLPETWITHDFSARWVTNLADALGRGGVPQDAVVVPLAVSQGGQPKGSIGVVWPVKNPAGLFAAPPPEPRPAKELIGQPKHNREADAAAHVRRPAALHAEPPADQGSRRRHPGREAAEAQSHRRAWAGLDHPVRQVVRRDARSGGRQSSRGLRRGREGRRQVRPANHRHGDARRAVHSRNGQRREEDRIEKCRNTNL